MKMKRLALTFNVIWWAAVIINFCSIAWFVLGNTANFQRGVDLVTTILFLLVGVASLVLLAWSLLMLINGGVRSPYSMLGAACLIITMIWLSVPLYKNVNTSGWLTENIKTDTIQVTADNRYEYCIELVNTFQRNSSIRLYLKTIHSNEESRIILDLPQVSGISWNARENFFTILEPTIQEGEYLLTTQRMSPFPEAQFQVNVKDAKAIKLE